MLDRHYSSTSISPFELDSIAQHADMMMSKALLQRVPLQYASHLRGKWQPLSPRQVFNHADGGSCSWQLLRINLKPGGSCLLYARQLHHHSGLFLVRTSICKAAIQTLNALPPAAFLNAAYMSSSVSLARWHPKQQARLKHSMLQPTGKPTCRSHMHLVE